MIRQFTILSALILACAIFNYAQINEKDASEVFVTIPPGQRSKLVARLNLFIDLEKNKKWDESYKMISDTFKENIKSGYPLTSYKDDKNIKIQKFTAHGLAPVSNETVYAIRPIEEIKEHYFIDGCGRFRGGDTSKVVLIEAYWENGDWYFSFMQLLGFEGGSGCSHKKKK